MVDEFRVIPGYEKYGVNEVGMVVSFERNIILSSYFLNDYWVVDTFRNSLTETLPIHRAVALAWVINPNPVLFNVVNHRDGDKYNNHWNNLEWTNTSGNNYHAVNTGLRKDNISCKVRNFLTKEIHYFNSIAQASEFMGLSKDTHIEMLQPKMFGKLVCDRFEFKFQNDETPWFYENRSELIKPSRYMVSVKNEDGTVEEVYSNRDMLGKFQLYDSTSKSIPSLAEFGNMKYPNKEFHVRDSFSEKKNREFRKTKNSTVIKITAINGTETLNFDSLSKAANFFNVDRSSILNRIGSDKNLNGWTFTKPD